MLSPIFGDQGDDIMLSPHLVVKAQRSWIRRCGDLLIIFNDHLILQHTFTLLAVGFCVSAGLFSASPIISGNSAMVLRPPHALRVVLCMAVATEVGYQWLRYGDRTGALGSKLSMIAQYQPDSTFAKNSRLLKSHGGLVGTLRMMMDVLSVDLPAYNKASVMTVPASDFWSSYQASVQLPKAIADGDCAADSIALSPWPPTRSGAAEVRVSL